jgi:hypothetical protein
MAASPPVPAAARGAPADDLASTVASILGPQPDPIRSDWRTADVVSGPAVVVAERFHPPGDTRGVVWWETGTVAAVLVFVLGGQKLLRRRRTASIVYTYPHA